MRIFRLLGAAILGTMGLGLSLTGERTATLGLRLIRAAESMRRRAAAL